MSMSILKIVVYVIYHVDVACMNGFWTLSIQFKSNSIQKIQALVLNVSVIGGELWRFSKTPRDIFHFINT